MTRASAGNASSADRPPVCGFTLDGRSCRKRGDHFCVPRADHVVAFFCEVLVHTKGRYARRPFEPRKWQREEILRPVFGRVRWSPEHEEYARQHQVVWIELARKNGKSEILAGIMLYLLVADGEESAELYGCARDKDQASLVFDVAKRMVQLSPILSKRLKVIANSKRIIDPKTNSVYQVIAADAMGALGSNPSGIAADEILAWRGRDMWDAQRTGMGSSARRQPLMVAATTAGNDPAGFAASMHKEMQKIADDPARSPHTFAFMRNTPDAADPFDEKNWYHANPALGDFLSLESMRAQAKDASNDPAQENSFKQFRLNIWVRQTSRWMPMHRYNDTDNIGALWLSPDWGREALAGRIGYGGLDLAAKFDLCAWCVVLPDDEPDGPIDALWRFWLPEDALPGLDKANDGKFTRWVQDGWIRVTEGGVLDFDAVYEDIAEDAQTFHIRGVDADEWSTWPVLNTVADRLGLDVDNGDLAAYKNTYDRMTPGMNSIMAAVKKNQLRHHGNPVAEFCFDSVEVRKAAYDPNLIRPDKPERDKNGKRIDAVPTLAMAMNNWQAHLHEPAHESAYEDHSLEIA